MTGTVTHFPFAHTVEPVPNDARLEWLFSCLTGMEPARAKRLILQARMPEVAIIDDATARLAIDALGLAAF